MDAGDACRCNNKKTEYLIDNWDPGTLWTDFGIRADITASLSLSVTRICLSLSLQPFTADFPRADIYELLSPDLLHQVIKGTFKDHIVMWVNEYLLEAHGEAQGLEIIADIDHQWVLLPSYLISYQADSFLRISVVPAFPGLRRFPDGRDFEQWTGDDSKALMKVSFTHKDLINLFIRFGPQVYLAAIAGHVPSEVVKCLSAFLDFCYIARRNAITFDALDQLQGALDRFHHYREFFIGTAGVNGDFISLPRQHSLLHYLRSIRLFGSPNGLCSSITESKHIKSVKEPWRRSSHYKALVQMLRTLCRVDTLSAAQRGFRELGMMAGTTATYTAMVHAGGEPQPRSMAEVNVDEDDDEGSLSGPKTLSSVELARLHGTFLFTTPSRRPQTNHTLSSRIPKLD